MTNEPLWRPGTDPNAETQAVPPGTVPHQAPAPEPGETAVYRASDSPEFPRQPRFPEDPDAPRRGSANRRRVLIALGGITLLGAGGVATAYAVEGHGPSGQGALGAGSPSARAGSRSATPATRSSSAAAPPSSASPAGSSASAGASPSGSASSTGPLPPGTKVQTSPQYYVDDAGPMGIALTMDDGPHPVYTPQVLEVLAHYGVKATFNMIGSQIGRNLSLVREVSAAGHTITNHTWDHADLSNYSFTRVCSEIDRCNDALANANQHPTIFRAPYGNWSPAVYEACAARRLRAVAWSVDPRDWDTSHVTTQQIVRNVLSHTRAHSIILEHDGGGVRTNTVAALKIFIPQLLDRGYRFVAM